MLPDEDTAAALYDTTGDECARAGLLAYEVSNYARPGEESRHNLAYWRYLDYAALGRARMAGSRSAGRCMPHAGTGRPEAWADRVERNGDGLTSDEPVEAEDRAREALLMGLRLTEGIEVARFEGRTGRTLAQSVDADVLSRCISEGYLMVTHDRLTATREGRIRLEIHCCRRW